VDGDELVVQSVGRRALLHNGREVEACRARPGDTLAVQGVVGFLVEWRPARLVASSNAPFPFGAADAHGMVGETPAMWGVRGALEEVAALEGHVLVLGESGAGKELVAQAVHALSGRRGTALVSRNAAAIPSSLIEAELFGHAANYPSSGMSARPGLIGAADGTTLFLDEIAELGELQQANLLRVLDAGEYQRLGEERVRRSSFRLVAATNRDPAHLKHDFLARFADHIHVPSFNGRRADIPLLIRKLLRDDPAYAERQRTSLALMDALVRHTYKVNHRELSRLLRLSARSSNGPVLDLTDEVRAELDLRGHADSEEASPVTHESVREALANTGSMDEAAKRLGLPSRFALHRVMRKLAIDAPPRRTK
jgi:two-component system nitrogen regulation response regulator GlnG/two-component system response regulator HydG